MAKKIYNTNGIRSLYQGLSGILVRNVPTFGIFFVTQVATLAALKESYGSGVGPQLIAGGAAGCVSWFACYPADVIKSRLQADALHRDKR